MQRLLIPVGISLSLLMSALVAEEEGDEGAVEPEFVTEREEVYCGCPITPAGVITCDPDPVFPSAGPRVCCGSDVTVTADFILWYVSQEGLSFSSRHGGSSVASVEQKGATLDPGFGVNPGYKIGFGVDISHDEWDFYAQYTWLHANGSKKKTKEDEQASSTLIPLWYVGGQLSPSSRLLFASGRWELHFNVIDLELGRNMFFSKYFSFRPFIGMKGTWQDQDYHVTYKNSPANVDTLYKLSIDHDYWGIGIRSGYNGAFHFSPCWSLYGNGAISALWSLFQVTRRDDIREDFLNPDSLTLRNFFTENGFHILEPVLELALGLRFERWFCDGSYHIALSAGWEEQVYFSQNQYYRVFEECSHGDLTMQGLDLRFRLDF